MNLEQIQSEIAKLSHDDFTEFGKWFDEFANQVWDRQIEADIAAGKLDRFAKISDEHFEAGRTTRF